MTWVKETNPDPHQGARMKLRADWREGVLFLSQLLITPIIALAADPADMGRQSYERYCAACHGAEGDGNGPAAVWLFPRPRNFSAGQYKIQSTPAGSLPSDEDLLRSITRGLGGSSMPGFAYLPEEERRALVSHVKELTSYAGPDGRRVRRFEEAKAAGTLAEAIVPPPEPPLTFGSITRGRELYIKLQCATCHGDNGAGDGPSAPTLLDAFGIPVPPRDFNTGAFRGGATGPDLYTRIAVGIAGTPMVAYPDDVISPAERWDLVHFIQSLRRKDAEINDILTPEDGVIPVTRVSGKLPLDPADPEWERVDSVRAPLNPLWPEPLPVAAVAVRAVHDGRSIAIMLQWRDDTLDGAPVRSEDFQDAVAIQFSINGTFPFLGMGDPENPVNIWQWRAGWQQTAAGQPVDKESIYPAMHVDLYPEAEKQALYRTAEAAGNRLARQTVPTPVEDINARGFGTTTSQPPDRQNVQGKGLWRDNAWSVVFHRSLESPDPDDVQIRADRPTPVAFGVWNGAQRDRNGRKVISNWFQLVLRP
jgi:mono/diheme cytochrome c family protein